VALDAELYPVALDAELSPVALDAELSPVALDADLSPVALDADLSPVALDAELYPVALDADLYPVALDAELYPVALDAELSPVALDAELSPVALDDPWEAAWMNLICSGRMNSKALCHVPTCSMTPRRALHFPPRSTMSAGFALNTIHFSDQLGSFPSPSASPRGHPCKPPPHLASSFQSGADTSAPTVRGH
jgi:hypothetical protein